MTLFNKQRSSARTGTAAARLSMAATSQQPQRAITMHACILPSPQILSPRCDTQDQRVLLTHSPQFTAANGSSSVTAAIEQGLPCSKQHLLTHTMSSHEGSHTGRAQARRLHDAPQPSTSQARKLHEGSHSHHSSTGCLRHGANQHHCSACRTRQHLKPRRHRRR